MHSKCTMPPITKLHNETKDREKKTLFILFQSRKSIYWNETYQYKTYRKHIYTHTYKYIYFIKENAKFYLFLWAKWLETTK